MALNEYAQVPVDDEEAAVDEEEAAVDAEAEEESDALMVDEVRFICRDSERRVRLPFGFMSVDGAQARDRVENSLEEVDAPKEDVLHVFLK